MEKQETGKIEMTITAKVIEDSIGPKCPRITSLELRYPRFIHSEFMTHRQFSRNASSSRAIPIARQIAAIKEDTAMPIHWGKHQKGMQAFEENDALIYGDFCGLDMINNRFEGLTPEKAWLKARDRAIEIAEGFLNAGYHKQLVNRLLEPFSHITVIMTTTTLDNFLGLRRHPDAQPEIKALADAVFDAVQESEPQFLDYGQWHLPYVTTTEKNYVKSDENVLYGPNPTTVEDLIKVSVARCARVSYKTHDGKAPNYEQDLALYDRLVGSEPLHASPAEHQATPDSPVWGECELPIWEKPRLHGNFDGWVQYRKTLPGECINEYKG